MPRLALLTVAALAALLPATADAGEVVVRMAPGAGTAQAQAAARAVGATAARPAGGGRTVLALRPGRSVDAAVRAVRRRAGVAAASPRLIARIAGSGPDDTGLASRAASAAGGWARAQWNLTGRYGIRARAAWRLARHAGRPPGGGIKVALLDTGLAYADHPPSRRSPDIAPARVAPGYDFVDDDPLPLDANGHGTFVASEIGAAADNRYGMVGVAYAATLMPVRVLDAEGIGSAPRIARGMRWAVNHGARVLNVSIELYDTITEQAESMTSDPAIRGAVRYAARRGAVVVAATGNSGSPRVPSRVLGSKIVYVGGSTQHGCLGEYSDHGPGLDLVAPGGGDDAVVPGDPSCRPDVPGRNVLQVSFEPSAPGDFRLVHGRDGRVGLHGTSMAAPHVTAAVALLLAARTLGAHPSPAAVAQRLRATARDLGPPGFDAFYGAGLLDAARALSG
jgi:serine protease